MAARARRARNSLYIRHGAGGALRALASAAELSGIAARREGVDQHVPAWRLVSSDRQHAVSVDLREQCGGRARTWALSVSLSGLRLCGGAGPSTRQPDLAHTDGRSEWRDRRCPRRLSDAPPRRECAL